MKNLHRNVVIFCMKTFIMPITWLIYIYIYMCVCVCVFWHDFSYISTKKPIQLRLKLFKK